MNKAATPSSNPAAALDQVEIFAPGRRLSTSGQVYNITAADVLACAAAYDPAHHKAPHVIGHPKSDDPAYGWVDALVVNAAGKLCISKSSQVQPAFAELVTGGAYPKRSAAFYAPDDARNPTPGTWHLRHVGWLGAAPPAIKGLADLVAYGEAEPDLVAFGDWDDELNASLWRRVREWLITQFGTDTADKVVPAYDLDSLQREALRPEPPDAQTTNRPNLMTAYAEGDPPVTTAVTAPDPALAALAAQRAELDAREARITAAETAQRALLKSARSAGIAQFSETMVAEGRWLPPEAKRWVAFMEGLPDEAMVVEFAEGSDTELVNSPALEVFQAQMRALPPRVEFAELAGRSHEVAAVNTGSASELGRAAVEFQEGEKKAGRTVSFENALQHIVDTHKKD